MASSSTPVPATLAPAPTTVSTAAPPRRRHPWLSPLVPRGRPRALAARPVGSSWCSSRCGPAVTLGGFVPRTFLADPLTMAREGVTPVHASTTSSATSA